MSDKTTKKTLRVDRLWTTDDIAAYLQVAVGTVRNMSSRGQLPVPVDNIGRSRRWRPDDVIAFFGPRRSAR
ncbi:helix-turn-helix domain-containing protein [Leifsonia sp. fls2-241-R2A-40a]|uniref:helix-turn-helix transcriptional regulator n=1 Tax=Leifsonia sp. fls2-241-R2A-40a TaxID=3040290 RepID=UPI00255170FD|nr:helix-turn-helix domain-containing protein [Leifsonia sp. fls2-241-R2A-40a]